MGLVEIHGSVLADQYLTTPFSRKKCIYYYYEIEEYRKHTSKDSQGREQTHYRWESVGRGEKRTPFWAKDETGQAYVDPIGATFTIPPKKVFYQRGSLLGTVGGIIAALKNHDTAKGTFDPLQWGLEEQEAGKHVRVGMRSQGDRRYTEYFIEPEEQLFLLGTASHASNNQVVLKQGANEKTFMISDKSEQELLKGLFWRMLFAFFFGLAFIGGSLFAILYGLGKLGGG